MRCLLSIPLRSTRARRSPRWLQQKRAQPRFPPYGTVVTASRSDATSTGSSATTVTRSQIESLPGGDNQTIAHLVEMQPGAVADNAFGFGTHVRAADGAVLYVIDGIPLMPPPIGMLGQTLDAIPTRLIQNVQVFTGGFPVEYSYALGGVVDIQTRRPNPDATAEAQVAYGTYNATTASLNYSQTFGRLSLIASGDFESTERGFDTPDAIAILHDGRVGGEGFLKADYAIDSSNRLSLLATYSENHFQIPIDATMLPLSDAPPGAVRGNDSYGNAPPQFVPYNANPTDVERSLLTAVSFVHTGEVSTQASLYMREMYADYDCDPTDALGATADPGAFCASITRRAYHFGGVGNVTWNWLPGNHWKAGVAIDDQQNNLGVAQYTRDDASPTGGVNPSLTLAGSDQINTLSVGAYVEDRIEVGKLTLLPGFRYDVQNTTFASSNQAPLFLSGPSARLGGSYALSDVVILHAFAGYLWETPVDFDGPLAAQILIPSLAGQTLPDDLKASTTWSAELGVTVHPVSKLSLGATAWGRYSTNTIDRQTVGSTDLFVSFNWKHGRAAGGDLFANGELLRFGHDAFLLEGFGNVSYQNSQAIGLTSEKYLFAPDELAAAANWTPWITCSSGRRTWACCSTTRSG